MRALQAAGAGSVAAYPPLAVIPFKPHLRLVGVAVCVCHVAICLAAVQVTIPIDPALPPDDRMRPDFGVRPTVGNADAPEGGEGGGAGTSSLHRSYPLRRPPR